MAKIFTYVIATQIIANGFWFCATQQESIGKTPLIVIPTLASIFVAISFGIWVKENW